MITDTGGTEITYWPLTGLVAGEDGPHLTVVVPTPSEGMLRATFHPDVIIFGRRAGTTDAFTDLADGLPLHGLVGPSQQFELFARAAGTITGVERAALYVGAGNSAPAGWRA